MTNEKSLLVNPDEKIAKIELETGRITYRTLADYVGYKILCSDKILKRYGKELQVNNCDNLFDEEGNPYEICQYFIITRDGYEFLEEFAPNEILFYDNELDIHIWGITHWGTPWKYIFTNIKAERA